MLPFKELLLKLLPGALAVLFIGGAGYYFGLKVKQVEVDKLQSQLDAYKDLGDRMSAIATAVDKDMKDKNQALVDAYTREIEKIRGDFGDARKSLQEATVGLKRTGNGVKATAGDLMDAIRRLPPGPQRDAKIAELLDILGDPQKRQAFCAVTPVADAQMQKLKLSFKIGAL